MSGKIFADFPIETYGGSKLPGQQGGPLSH